MKNTTAKRRFVIIACMVLLLIALLAMSVSTFAKYITTAEVDSKSATVAKWGFVLDAKYGELGAAQAASTEGEGQLALNSSNTELIPNDSTAAPEFSIRGTAEVDAELAFNLQVNDIYLKKEATGEVYNPLRWTLKKADADGNMVVVDAAVDENETNELTNKTFAEIKDYLDSLVDDNVDETTGVENIAKNNKSGLDGSYELSYVWVLDNDAPSTIAGLTGNNADSILGTMATLVDAENPVYEFTHEGYTANLKLDIALDISVEQAG